MTYRGTVKGGVVILEGGAVLPEGETVEVRPLSESQDQRPTLFEQLKDVVGTVQDLPPDAARNKRHYLYGHSRQ